MRILLLIVALLLSTSKAIQTQTLPCPAGGVLTTTLTVGGGSVTTCKPPTPVGTAPVITSFTGSATTITLGQSVRFNWTVTGTTPITLTLDLAGTTQVVTGTSFTWFPPTTGTKLVRLTASNGILPNGTTPGWTVTVVGSNPTEPIYPGPVTDVNLLGNCTQAAHDAYLVSGGDGFRYWKWHPQALPNGCVLAHEHGHDPQPVINSLIAHFQAKPLTATFTQAYKDALIAYLQKPILMGYVTRRVPGHPPEPHAGFKIFFATFNEENDESRFSTMLSLHMTHMGTGGQLRFTQPHHSVVGWQVHIPSGAFEAVQLMVDFGTADMVCDPRNGPKSRDFIVVNFSRCKINSSYEIWTGSADIRENGQTLYRKFATPAVFDPITVMDRSNPSRVIYAWDPLVTSQTRAFSTPSWDFFRGCNREAYAQPGNYEVAGDFMKWTDPFGVVVPQTAVNALLQFFGSPVVSTNLRGSFPRPGEAEGNHAFKKERPNCNLSGSLKLLN